MGQMVLINLMKELIVLVNMTLESIVQNSDAENSDAGKLMVDSTFAQNHLMHH